MSPTYLSCVSPAHAVGIVGLEISSIAQPLVNEIVNFEFTESASEPSMASHVPVLNSNDTLRLPIVYTVEPKQLPSMSNQAVVVIGDFFENVATLGCIFNELEPIRATWLSHKRVVCQAPRHVPMTVELKLTNDGRSFSTSSTTLEFYADTSVSALVPCHGPLSGGTRIRVFGENFVQTSTSTCRFGSIVTPQLRWISSNELECATPPAPLGHPGSVPVEASNNNLTYTTSGISFSYDATPAVTRITPHDGPTAGGTEILLSGRLFADFPTLGCRFNQVYVVATFVSESILVCVSPAQPAQETNVEITFNGADYYATSLVYEFYSPPAILSLWPTLSHSFEGTTIVSVFGTGFRDSMRLACIFDSTEVQATHVTPSSLMCKAPPHPTGLVVVRVTVNGIDYAHGALNFMYVPQASVRGIFPSRGLSTGQVIAFVTGSNFVNTTALKCKFDAVHIRATFVDSTTVACMVPAVDSLALGWRREISGDMHEESELSRRLLGSSERLLVSKVALPRVVDVSVSNNGLDFTDSSVSFEYYAQCDVGYFCGGILSTMCPNGTVCRLANPTNFTLCQPGTFQPRSGQCMCILCPVGYYCPDHGMVKPIVCPAGFVCDKIGLRIPTTYCPSGHWCQDGTKTARVYAFVSQNTTDDLNFTGPYIRDYETGIVTFDATRRSWPYLHRHTPATGVYRVEHPPTFAWAEDESARIASHHALKAEQPFPCPFGYWCGPGATTPFPIPLNFSTPQRCYDGYFCPRGSSMPEGTGPCPSGFFCPTQALAVASRVLFEYSNTVCFALQKASTGPLPTWVLLPRRRQHISTRVLSGDVATIFRAIKLYSLPNWTYMPWVVSNRAGDLPCRICLPGTWSLNARTLLSCRLLVRVQSHELIATLASRANRPHLSINV